MMDYSRFAFPKGKGFKEDPIRIYPDGREVCNKASGAGFREYRRRIVAMVRRQGFRCCLEAYAPNCPGMLSEDDATFEHEWGRGMGGAIRDDRIWLPDGSPINGAAHLLCNQWKGSRYIAYNRGVAKLAGGTK